MVLFCVDEVRNYGIKVVCSRSGLVLSVRFCKLKEITPFVSDFAELDNQ